MPRTLSSASRGDMVVKATRRAGTAIRPGWLHNRQPRREDDSGETAAEVPAGVLSAQGALFLSERGTLSEQ